MLGLYRSMFRRPFGRKPAPAIRRTRLGVEAMEGRDCPAVTVQFTQPTYTVNETNPYPSGPTLIALVGMGGMVEQTTTITFTVNITPGPAPAASSGDYMTYGSMTYSKTFTPGYMGDAHPIPIQAFGDGVQEPDEYFTLSLSGVSGATVGSPATSVVKINGDIPTVTVSAPSKVTEGGSGTVTVSRTGQNIGQALPITLVLSGGAGASDYTLNGSAGGAGEVTFTMPANVWSVDLPLAALRDNLVEGDEVVGVAVKDGMGNTPKYATGTPAPASVTLADDPPVITVETVSHAGEAGSDNGVKNGSFKFTRTGGDTKAALTATYFVRQIPLAHPATPGDDYTALAETVTFGIDETVKVVTVVPKKDNLVEGDEVVRAEITGDGSKYKGAGGYAEMTLADDPPVVSVVTTQDGAESDPPAASPSSPREIKFEFTRTGGDLSAPLTVYFSPSGKGVGAADIGFLPATEVTFPASGGANPWNKAVFTILPIDDEVVEGQEEVVVTLIPDPTSGVPHYKLSADAVATAVIGDNDVEISGFYWKDENADGIWGDTEPAVSGGTVRLQNTGGNDVMSPAVTGSDGAYKFIARSDTAYQIKFDLPGEGDFLFTGQDVGGDDDRDSDVSQEGKAPVPPATAGEKKKVDAGVKELAVVTVQATVPVTGEQSGLLIIPPGEIKFSVTGGDSTKPLTIFYKLTSGQGFATDAVDYKENLFGEVTIPAGPLRSVTIYVTPNSDKLKEGAEKVEVTLRAGAGYTIGAADKATVTINDSSLAAVGNFVWDDKNYNSVYDAGEPGISGVVVALTKANDATFSKTVATDNSGKYEFRDLEPGSYTLSFTSPAGFVPVGYQVGNDTNKDSDIGLLGPNLGKTGVIVLAAGDYREDIDAGYMAVGNNFDLNGPSVVPGNSEYWYTARVPGIVGPQTGYEFRLSAIGGGALPAGVVTKVEDKIPTVDGAGNATVIGVKLRFANSQPFKFKIELVEAATNTVKSSKDIVLVQVTVAIANSGETKPPEYKSASQTQVQVGVADTNVIPNLMKAQATVTLVGPGMNEGVDKISVGFVQIEQPNLTVRAFYDSPSGQRIILGPDDGKGAAIDLAAGSSMPFYSTNPDRFYNTATPANSSATIKTADSPANSFPLVWDTTDFAVIKEHYADSSLSFIKGVKFNLAFSLNVAARTTDASGGGSNSVWAEAQVPWTLSIDREIASITPVKSPEGILQYFNVTWKDPVASAVTIASPNWTVLNAPSMVDATLPIANIVAAGPKIKVTVP